MESSQSQQHSKSNTDLLDLGIFQNPVISNTSTPINSYPYSPLHSSSQPILNLLTPSSSKCATTDLLDLGVFQNPFASNASIPISSRPFSPTQSSSQRTLNSFTLSSSSKYAGTDLLDLGIFQSPIASNACTPISAHPYATPQNLSQPTFNLPTLSSTSKYADLGDLFLEAGHIQPPTLSMPRISQQNPALASGCMSIPRPLSRKSEGAHNRAQTCPATIFPTESVSNLKFKTACMPIAVSREPSLLTFGGMARTIPLAVAFHEIVHSLFRGIDESKCQVKMSGEMMLSFPAGIITVLANNPNLAKLAIRICSTQRLSNILPNEQLVLLDGSQIGSDSLILQFNMSALIDRLKVQAEQNHSASYLNVEVLRYQIIPKPETNSCPIQLVSYWRCGASHISLKINYKYNSRAMHVASPLLNVNIIVPIDGAVRSIQSKPTAQWSSESNRLLWKFTELSQHSENHGVGSLLAELDMESGPSTPRTIYTLFNCEGTTLSGIDFQVFGSDYRLSLVKRRFISGKYICNGETNYSVW